MRSFETTDVIAIEMLKTRHETLKTKFAAAERAQDVRRAAEIASEMREIADKASDELLRIADRLAASTEERSHSWRRRLVG
jgi:hypothetical protein